jgi:uncharacterized membrane protein HdeD (DUF308 family)
MAADLTTTNILLGIMAGVSVLQGLVVVALLLAVVLLCRGVLQTVRRLEQHQLTPALARVNAILDDVQGVTSTVRAEAGRMDRFAEWIVERLGGRHAAAGERSTNKVM